MLSLLSSLIDLESSKRMYAGGVETYAHRSCITLADKARGTIILH